jgi:hypothetical protein
MTFEITFARYLQVKVYQKGYHYCCNCFKRISYRHLNEYKRDLFKINFLIKCIIGLVFNYYFFKLWLFKDIKQCIIKNKRKIVMKFKDLKKYYNPFIFMYVIDIFE